MNFPTDIVSAALGGICAVAGAIAGGLISSVSSNRSKRKEFRSEAYASVITEYILYFTTDATYPPSSLLSAIEIAWLISPKPIAAILRKLETAVIQKDPNKELCGKLLDEFRSAAKHSLQ